MNISIIFLIVFAGRGAKILLYYVLSFRHHPSQSGEMADAADSKSADRKVVWVRLPPLAPTLSTSYCL